MQTATPYETPTAQHYSDIIAPWHRVAVKLLNRLYRKLGAGLNRMRVKALTTRHVQLFDFYRLPRNNTGVLCVSKIKRGSRQKGSRRFARQTFRMAGKKSLRRRGKARSVRGLQYFIQIALLLAIYFIASNLLFILALFPFAYDV